MTTQGYSRYVHRHIIQTLNELDPDSYATVPMLAGLPDVFARPDGGIDYTFDINEKAHWPDGSPVTADDVVFSLKLLFDPLLAPIGPYRGYYDMIDGITMTPANAKRIKIGTNKPYILSEAALGSIPVYPAYAYDPDGLLSKVRLSDLLDPTTAKRLGETDANLIKFSEQFSDPMYAREPGKVVGSGPYQLTSWEAGQSLRLEKVDNYWADGASEPWLANEPDAIEYQFIKEGATVANALRDQEFDAVVELEVAKFRELREEPQTSRYYDFDNAEGFVYNSLMLNNADPILKDQRVRRALAHLTDVEALVENNYGNLATRITTPILPQKPYYDTSLTPIEFDPDKAVAMLEEAGWSDTNGNGTVDKVIDGVLTELQLNLNAFTSEVANNIALMMQQSAKIAGVDIQIVPMDGRALYGSLNKGEFQIATMASGSEPIPDDLTQVFSTSSIPPNGGNRMRYGDAESDALIRQIRGELNVNKRDELYRRLQKKIYDDQPMIFLFSVDGRTITSKRFKAETSSLSPGFRANTFVQEDWNKQE
jgi:peptide/nickel transport system substrate-binding protein